MNEIVQILRERAGLNPDQAQEVATAIVGLIKSKVPSELQGMVDQYLGCSGDAQAGSNVLAAWADCSARRRGCSAARASFGSGVWGSAAN